MKNTPAEDQSSRAMSTEAPERQALGDPLAGPPGARALVRGRPRATRGALRQCEPDTVYLRVRIRELDLETMPLLEHEIDLASSVDTRSITLDMCCVEFMDCSGIGAIVRVSRRLRSRGIRLTLRRVGEQPRWLLGFVGLDTLIES